MEKGVKCRMSKKIFAVVVVSLFSIYYSFKIFSIDMLYERMTVYKVDNETILNQDMAVFGGVIETQETPWNINAGQILLEDETTCLFLTPNTSVEIGVVESVCFNYRIHPWVSANSDGAGIQLRLLDEKGRTVFEDNLEVRADCEWEKYTFNLKNYPEVKTVKISCNMGKTDSASCDWVIIK